MKKVRCLILVLLLPVLLLTGCGNRENPFQVLFAAPFVNEELMNVYTETLSPESEKPVQYASFYFGSPDVDPMAYGAGAMMMTAMVAAGEVDVMVCDLNEAPRYARSGIFYDLTEFFSEEELAGVSDRLLQFDMVDEFGEPTGEKTALCGLDLSDRQDLRYILGSDSVGVFIVCGAKDPELAGEIFWEIVNA